MLSKKLATILLALLLASIGCVGDVSISGQNPDDEEEEQQEEEENDVDNERTLFETTVAPIMGATCGGAGCHADITPVFMVGGVADYDRVLSYPTLYGSFDKSVAEMLTQVDTGHQGVVYTPAERSAIEFWLDSELALREGDVPDIELTDQQALAEFSGCMTLANWNAAGMGEWSDLRAGGLPCASCHAGGGAGFNTNPVNDTMFLMNRQYDPNAFILGFFVVQPDPLTGDPVVQPARAKLEIMAEGGGEGSNHDPFNYEPGSESYQWLEQFYTLTIQEMQINPACKEVGFPQP